MKRERNESNLWLSSRILGDLCRIAEERRCTLADLADEQIPRIESDAQYAYYLLPFVNEIIKRRIEGKCEVGAWPEDPLECLAVALIRDAKLKAEIETLILTMSGEDLDCWDAEVKKTGKSMEFLLWSKIYGPGWDFLHPTKLRYDWWKRP
jgi:hypothetical protein